MSDSLRRRKSSLGDLVAAGRFRSDLQARLERHVFEIPPLRRRREDIGLLTAAILLRGGVREGDGRTIGIREMESLLVYDWPQNIRELENRLLAALATAKDGVLRPSVPSVSAPPLVPERGRGIPLRPAADERRRAELDVLLEKHRGNVSAVAEELGRSREWTYRLIDRFGLDPVRHRRSPRG
jgi:sigma-54 dependent transcriptional regulator, acetoin dehydrogenase operon transcriptional activator AcoR